jgi:hypothetical protein
MAATISDAGQTTSARLQQNSSTDVARARRNVDQGPLADASRGIFSGSVGDSFAVSASAKSQQQRASGNQAEVAGGTGLTGGFSLSADNGLDSLAAEAPTEAADRARQEAVFAPIQAVDAQANIDSGRALQLLS